MTKIPPQTVLLCYRSAPHAASISLSCLCAPNISQSSSKTSPSLDSYFARFSKVMSSKALNNVRFDFIYFFLRKIYLEGTLAGFIRTTKPDIRT